MLRVDQPEKEDWARAADVELEGLTLRRRFVEMVDVPVKGFESYLVFYLPHQNGIDMIRVIHGARDIESLFAREEA
jgi:hypothetical protein